MFPRFWRHSTAWVHSAPISLVNTSSPSSDIYRTFQTRCSWVSLQRKHYEEFLVCPWTATAQTPWKYRVGEFQDLLTVNPQVLSTQGYLIRYTCVCTMVFSFLGLQGCRPRAALWGAVGETPQQITGSQPRSFIHSQGFKPPHQFSKPRVNEKGRWGGAALSRQCGKIVENAELGLSEASRQV